MPHDAADLEARCTEVAALLKSLANPRRLRMLCQLAGQGPMPAGALAEAVGLSQSALSQHLARMRAEGLVTFDRRAQVLRYRIADPRIAGLLDLIHRHFCDAGGQDV